MSDYFVFFRPKYRGASTQCVQLSRTYYDRGNMWALDTDLGYPSSSSYCMVPTSWIVSIQKANRYGSF